VSNPGRRRPRSAFEGLYRRLLEGGRPVQFRTFHGWFAGLLRNAPLATLRELGLPSNYELLEDDAEARGHTWRPFFEAVTADKSALADYYAVVAAHGRSQTAKALREALSKRVEFTLSDAEIAVQHFSRSTPRSKGCIRAGGRVRGEPVRAPLARPRGRARRAVEQDAAEGGRGHHRRVRHRRAGRRIAAAALAHLRKASSSPTEDRLNKNLLKFPAAAGGRSRAAGAVRRAGAARGLALPATHARLTRVLIAAFGEVKRADGWVDMNDVEQAAQLLLSESCCRAGCRSGSTPASPPADRRVPGHQPAAVAGLYGWLSAYVGAGGRRPACSSWATPSRASTAFAAPSRRCSRGAAKFVRDGLGGELLNCDHTRRNAREVLGRQPGDAGRAGGRRVRRLPRRTPPARRRGRTAEAAGHRPRCARPTADGGAGRRRHAALARQPGHAARAARGAPAARWSASRPRSGSRSASPTARRRGRSWCWRAARPPVGHAGRAAPAPHSRAAAREERAADAPEVQDVVALLDVLVSPAHDLSLARALKSPVFGVDDEALVQLALRQREREGTPAGLRCS
jgi:ATP-dependent helicase/nuclease subunit A